MEAKLFPRKVEFYHFINSLSDNFDLKKSLIAREHSFVTNEGKHVNSIHFSNFISNLNKELGTNFDHDASRVTPAGYVIVVKDDKKSSKKSENKEEKMEDKKEQGLEIQDRDLEVKDTVVVNEGQVESLVNEAKAIYDENAKKESKDKLAEFALSKGVTLAKNQTFEDMVNQFEKSLTEEK